MAAAHRALARSGACARWRQLRVPVGPDRPLLGLQGGPTAFRGLHTRDLWHRRVPSLHHRQAGAHARAPGARRGHGRSFGAPHRAVLPQQRRPDPSFGPGGDRGSGGGHNDGRAGYVARASTPHALLRAHLNQGRAGAAMRRVGRGSCVPQSTRTRWRPPNRRRQLRRSRPLATAAALWRREPRSPRCRQQLGPPTANK